MSDQPTLREVAALAGVHVSTASRVLNSESRKRVGEETVRRVVEAAEALNYRPSQLGRALRTNRTFTVGVAVPDLTNPVFPPVVRGLEQGFDTAGYTLIIANTDSDLLRERAVAKAMLNRQVDGLVLLTSHNRDPVVEELHAQDTPLVLVGRTVEEPDIPSVAADDLHGGELAVEHLSVLGHRRIAYVGGPQHVSTGRNRYQGFVAGMNRCGLDIDPALISFGSAFDDVSGSKACQDIMSWAVDFSAVVAGSDALALGCLDVLVDSGRRIPDDVSLVGYGGTNLAAHLRPQLTTVSVPYEAMGREGADLLLEEIAGHVERRHVVLSPVLTPGSSTAPI